MTDSDRSSNVSLDERSPKACCICGVTLGKFGVRHSKKHMCHTCNLPVCVLCSPHTLPEPTTGKPARACNTCWEHARGNVQALQSEVERLEAVLLETKQTSEADLILVKSEAAAHLLALRKLESELETCKAERNDFEKQAKTGEEIAKLLEEEQAISAKLREQLEEVEARLIYVKNEHGEEIKSLKNENLLRIKAETDTHLLAFKKLEYELATCITERDDLEKQAKTGAEIAILLEKEQAISAALREQLNEHSEELRSVQQAHQQDLIKQNEDLFRATEALRIAKEAKKRWKQEANLRETTIEHKEIEVNALAEEKKGMQAIIANLEENERILNARLKELLKKPENLAEEEAELQQTTLRLKDLSVLQITTEKELIEIKPQQIPLLQTRVQNLNSELESLRAALAIREKEKTKAEFQLAEARKHNEALSQELFKLKNPPLPTIPPQLTSPPPPEPCLRCAIM